MPQPCWACDHQTKRAAAVRPRPLRCSEPLRVIAIIALLIRTRITLLLTAPAAAISSAVVLASRCLLLLDLGPLIGRLRLLGLRPLILRLWPRVRRLRLRLLLDLGPLIGRLRLLILRLWPRIRRLRLRLLLDLGPLIGRLRLLRLRPLILRLWPRVRRLRLLLELGPLIGRLGLRLLLRPLERRPRLGRWPRNTHAMGG